MVSEEVGPDDIATVISAWTGIPAGRMLEGMIGRWWFAAIFILGGGSNLLISDDGFDGLVVHVDLRGVTVESVSCSNLNTIAPAMATKIESCTLLTSDVRYSRVTTAAL